MLILAIRILAKPKVDTTQVGWLIMDMLLVALTTRTGVTLIWGLRDLCTLRCQKMVRKLPTIYLDVMVERLSATKRKRIPRRGYKREEQNKVSSRRGNPMQRVRTHRTASHQGNYQPTTHQVRQPPEGLHHQPAHQSASQSVSLQANRYAQER